MDDPNLTVFPFEISFTPKVKTSSFLKKHTEVKMTKLIFIDNLLTAVHRMSHLSITNMTVKLSEIEI